MPDWNELVGKTVLLGLTFSDPDGNEQARVQRHGVVQAADREEGIALRFVAPGQPWDGEVYRLPPDLSAFREAEPGAYRLRSTGETIMDPDFTAAWVVSRPRPGEDTAEQRQARGDEARRLGFPTD